jgi:hypothetical protein
MMRVWRNKDFQFVCAISFLSLLLWLPRFRGPIDLRYDAGVYFILGTSLAEGNGYRLLNEPGDIQAVQYPPLLPAIIAVHEKVLGTSNPRIVGHALRFTYFLFTTGYLLAAYWMARRYLQAASAFLATLFCALFLHTYILSDLGFTEIPFGLATMLFFVASTGVPTRGKGIAAATAAFAAYLLRTMGIAVLGAWVLEAALRKQFRQAAVRAAIAAVPVLCWQVYIATVTHSAAYKHPAYAYQRADYMYYNVTYPQNIRLVDPFVPELGHATNAAMIARVARNLLAIPPALGEAVSAPRDFWTWAAQRTPVLRRAPAALIFFPIVLLGAFVIGGILLWFRRGQWLPALYVAASILLICLTPWPGQFARYLAPITPLLTVALVLAVIFVKRSTDLWVDHTGRLGRWLSAAIFGMVLLIQSFTTEKAFRTGLDPVTISDSQGNVTRYRLFYHDATWNGFNTAVDWLRLNARPTSIAAGSCPHEVFLGARIKAIMVPMEVDPAREEQLLESAGVTYVIVDGLPFVDITRRYLDPAIRSFPGRWQLVFTSPEQAVRIYKRTGSRLQS